VRGSSALILVCAISLSLFFVLWGLAVFAFGFFASLLGGASWLVFSVFGLTLLGCGIAFVIKVVVPAWQLTKGDV
jgi:hypothetical protein